MSVVGRGKVVFCEGKDQSLDYRLLDRLFRDMTKERPTIVPAGGKFTFSVFSEGYFSGLKPELKPHCLVFRDRDFDAFPTENIGLVPFQKNTGSSSVLMTHRTCIENYLLDATLMHEYWTNSYEKQQLYPSMRWSYKNSPGIEALKSWIMDSALALVNYQAVRWCLAELLNSRGDRKSLKTTWTGGSGNLPKDLNLDHCKQCATEMINEFQKSIEGISNEIFSHNLQKYVNKFSSDNNEFWDNEKYLIWFNGKDIQKEMAKQRMPNCKNPISIPDYFNWAVKNININHHPDILELRMIIEEL